MTPATIVLALVTLQRLGELWLARRNTAALLAQGGHEVARRHYPLIVGLHVAWLAGLWLFAREQSLQLAWLAVFVALQGLRIWVLLTLGRRWTTRIVIVPARPLIRHGPYRILSHPNYLVVAGEIAVLPLCFGWPAYALWFSLANAVVLAIRIRTENAALRDGAV